MLEENFSIINVVTQFMPSVTALRGNRFYLNNSTVGWIWFYSKWKLPAYEDCQTAVILIRCHFGNIREIYKIGFNHPQHNFRGNELIPLMENFRTNSFVPQSMPLFIIDAEIKGLKHWFPQPGCSKTLSELIWKKFWWYTNFASINPKYIRFCADRSCGFWWHLYMYMWYISSYQICFGKGGGKQRKVGVPKWRLASHSTKYVRIHYESYDYRCCCYVHIFIWRSHHHS